MQLYMERTLEDCPLPAVRLRAPYGLRPLVEAEEALWTQVQHGVFEPDSQQTYEAVYGEPDYEALQVLLATCDGQAVGIAAGAVRRTAAGVAYGYVDWVGVLAEHRGNRLGAALTVACLNFLGAAGLKHTGLWTHTHRHAAIRLYERLGFAVVDLPEGLGVGEYRQQRADAGFPPLS